MDRAREQITLGLLVSNAKRTIAELSAAEGHLLSMRNELLDRAWQLGKILTALKEQVGRGNWYVWLGVNLPELGSTERARQANAARCMRLYRDNSDRRNSCGRLSRATMRKFMWNYIPAKERLQLEGDSDISPGPHHLTFVSQFSKYDRQLRSRRVEGFEIETFKGEVEPMLRRIADLCGRDRFCKLSE